MYVSVMTSLSIHSITSLRIDLPAAERLAEEQLTTCSYLASTVNAAVDVLLVAGIAMLSKLQTYPNVHPPPRVGLPLYMRENVSSSYHPQEKNYMMEKMFSVFIGDLKFTSASTERQKSSQNLAPVLVMISGNSLVFCRNLLPVLVFTGAAPPARQHQQRQKIGLPI